MLRRFVLSVLLIAAPLYCNVNGADTFYPESVFSASEEDYFLHVIEPGQTVYSIARMYNLPEESIYRLNPGAREGVKAGAQLKIPQESGSYHYHTIRPGETLYSVSRMYWMKGEDILSVNPGLSMATFYVGKVIRIPTNRVTTPMMTDVNEEEGRTIRIALLLPFADNARMVEYLEGFLLALEEIKKRGVSVDLQVRDIGQGVQILSTLLKPDLQRVHLLIGGLSEKQIRMIADFSRQYNIPYVIPFNSKSDEPATCSTVYQISTPQSGIYSKAVAAFCERYRDASVVFHAPDAPTPGNRSDFVQALQKELTTRNVPYQALTGEEISSADILSVLSEEKNTVFVPSDDGADALSKLILPLRTALDQHPQLRVSLFGYPAWQVSGADYLSDLFRFNATFYSIYYVDVASPAFKTFYSRYVRWYTKELINTYPKFGLLGYDTGLFFIQALNRYGSDFASHGNDFGYSGIQMDFNFERVNNEGGYINASLYLVNFTPEGSITLDSIK
jgi:LysM repeat protein